MNARTIFDLLVIGADAAGFAAAACAAKSGATVSLIATGGEAPPAGKTPEPPNFVWRLLDLHLRDLRPEARGAQTTLAAGEALTTTGDPARTGEELGRRDSVLEHLWPAFAASMKGADDRPASSPDRFLSANAVLDDYFSDELLKTHVIASCVAPFGLAGDEAGSAAALASLGESGRRRIDARSLFEALADAAAGAAVDHIAGRLNALLCADGKSWKAISDSGREIRARRAMASSALLAEAAGLLVACNGSPLVRRAGAEAVIRLRFDKRLPAAAHAHGGLCFAAGDRAAIARARDEMIDGVIAEEPFLSFEIFGKEILARAPFCPARLSEGGAGREWTGQDKQILGRRAADVIAKALGVPVGSPREIDVSVGVDAAGGLARRSFDMPALDAPAPSADPVGAAASLALELIRHD